MIALLLRKILRSMWESRRAYLACVIVIGIGIMIFIALSSVSISLRNAVNIFYDDCRLADVFAGVRAMPRSSVSALERVEGVDLAAPRLALDVRVLTERSDKVVTLRLMGSLPDQEVALNDYIHIGSPIRDLQDILLDPDFIEAHHLAIGDTLETIIGGARTYFRICGIVQSPEYIYIIPSAKTILPDSESFGYAFVHNLTLETTSGNVGLINELGFSLQDGYSFIDIKDELEGALKPYGLVSLYERKDQVSYMMTDIELKTVAAVSRIMPTFFLSIASAVLYIMLRRIVEQERVIIGTLKAFGFADRIILACYILYGTICGLFGGLFGAILSFPMSRLYYYMLLLFYNIPEVAMHINPLFFFQGILLSIGISSIAAFFGVRGVLHLRPAESMRPAAPTSIKESFLDRSRLLKAALTSRGMMSFRYLRRNKVRAGFIMLSMALCSAMMTVVFSMNLMIDQIMLAQMERAQVYDYQISLHRPTGYTAVVNSIGSLEGVREAEGIFELPTALIYENVRKGVMLIGVPEGSQLYHIIDDDYRRYLPPQNGLLLNQGLADKLGIKEGDLLELDSPLLSESIYLPVIRIISQPFGNSGYMELNALCQRIGIDSAATTIVFNADPSEKAAMIVELLDARNVAVFEDKAGILQGYKDMMAPFRFLFIVF
ncbi:MAG: ABC transporter permease, partial [Symbiobacteriaceae bacterium]|nr:ABC transporter permease [Symbiobacteriaceae bacterium]